MLVDDGTPQSRQGSRYANCTLLAIEIVVKSISTESWSKFHTPIWSHNYIYIYESSHPR